MKLLAVILSPSLPLRCAQGCGSLKGKLREGSLSHQSKKIEPMKRLAVILSEAKDLYRTSHRGD